MLCLQLEDSSYIDGDLDTPPVFHVGATGTIASRPPEAALTESRQTVLKERAVPKWFGAMPPLVVGKPNWTPKWTPSPKFT
jgi:hypothetical protein